MARAQESTAAAPEIGARQSRTNTARHIELFHARLKERGLKSTGQRDSIAQVFFEIGGHVGAEELYGEVKRISPHLGYATIYRTLRLLKECELVYERHFDDGSARYEPVSERHHDHFICERCHKIIEFENENIERMQEIVARELGAVLTRHKMELYGICADCQAATPT